jgi:hydroxymethylpyrimidine/phosphomethylpyrimidine kinase
LLLGLFDPAGRQDIPADNVTCAAHGAHGLAVLTGIAIADSTGIQSVDLPSVDHLDEQARSLLEDMPIGAIKIGIVPSAETASVLAGLVADYGEVPMVLHLPAAELPPSEADLEETEPANGAVLELLLPQTDVVVIAANALDRWLSEDVVRHLDGASGPQSLLTLGAQWALIVGFAQRPGYCVTLLLGPDGQTQAWPWDTPPDRVQDVSGLVATSIAIHLANGLSVPEATQKASAYAQEAASRSFQPGMGQRLAARMPAHGSVSGEAST